ncbi:MAG: TRAP transporter large permease [Deltaproteobacteria bacterium]|nr:TRAP transporter large permease [Deltaproteobacteria bacterium]
MSPILTGIIGISILLILMFAGTPIGIAMLLVGSVGFVYLVKLSGALHILSSVPYGLISNYDYCVLPLFLLMGTIILNAGFGKHLFRFAYTLVGRMTGGLAIATVFACGIFAAVSASSIACAMTIGLIAIPEMRKYNYDNALCAGAVAAGGTLGILIPPSGIFIIYGIMTEQSIAELFVAGMVPGIILTLLFFAMINIWSRINPAIAPRGQSATFREKMASFVGCSDIMVLIILVLVGLIIGWFTPTEAGAIGAFGAILLSLIKKKLTWVGFKDAVIDAIQNTGMIFTIVMGALVFNAFFAVTTIPMELAEWVGRLALPPPVIMIIILVLYISLGTFLEELSMILLTLPIFYPIVITIGYDPIWFGVVVVLIVEMGMISPPVGMTMFVVKGIAPEIPIGVIFKGVLPFLISVFVLMFLIIAFPQIVLFLPRLMS